MADVNNFSAALDSSNVQLSYIEEVTWGTLQTAVTWKAIRITGESLSENKQRARPQEINSSGVVSHAITTQVGVEGAINFALSADTFDDFLAGALNGAWATDLLKNSVPPEVSSFSIQKKLNSTGTLWLRYTGCYVTGFTLNASVGNFVEGSFSFMAKDQTSATTNAASTITAAPTQRVMDTVAGVSTIEVDDLAFTTPIQSIQLNVTKEGARQQFAIGSSAAAGLGRGTLNVTGSLVMYFKDFTMFDKYKNETDIKLEFTLKDSALDGYKFTLPVVSLMNPNIVAGGPDQDIMAEFQMEAAPDANGMILQIDRIEQA